MIKFDRIIIGADFVPTPTNEKLFMKADIEGIFDSNIIKLFDDKSIFKVFNLESPFTNCDKKIDKFGPNLKIKPETIKMYEKCNINSLSLANNHIFDYGYVGLEDTVNILDDVGIDYFGLNKASKKNETFISVNLKYKKVAIFSCCDREFVPNDTEYYGVNIFDVFKTLKEITELKQTHDYVVVLYHGGKEHYRYPTPFLQKLCRSICVSGADLVICQHSHCIGCEEKYLESTIIYGQGNFLFDLSDREEWQDSLLVDLSVVEGQIVANYMPCMKNGSGVRIPNENDSVEIVNNFKVRSELIKSDAFVLNNFKTMVDSYLNSYLFRLKQTKLNSLFLRLLNKITKGRIKYKLFTLNQLLALRNFIECEAHREILLEGLISLTECNND